MGSACAYFLHAHCHYQGSILVVEPDPSYREAASTRSASSIRLQFSTPINIALSAFGMEFLRAAPGLLRHSGVAADVGLVESSYLYLATPKGRSILEERAAIQRSCAVRVELRDRAELAAHYPWLNCADLAAGCELFLTNDSGSMHIASALGVPTVAIFGATDDTTTGPTGLHARVVRQPVDCSPCLLRECPIDHRCMTRVSAERVVKEALELLQPLPHGNGSIS